MSLEYNVLAFDPGVTTGVCIVERHVGEPLFRVTFSGVIPWNNRFELSRQLIKAGPYSEVACEQFRLYKNKAQDQIGQDFPSSQMTGTIAAWCYHYEQRLVIRPASIMGRVEILDEHLPLLHKSEHARDAYKHARYALTALMMVRP